MTLARLYDRLVNKLNGVFKAFFKQQPSGPPPIIADLLPDNPLWDEQGLLPSTRAFDPLPVAIPAWPYEPGPFGETVLRVYWDTITLVHEKTWSADLPSLPPQDLLFEMPASYLVAGAHVMLYEVTDWAGNPWHSFPQPVTVDLTPPILGDNQGRLRFDTSQITAEYLESNGDKVDAWIDSYRGGKPGDVVTWYWSETPFYMDDRDIVSQRLLYQADLVFPIMLSFTGGMIRARGDGDRYAFYRLADRAGNLSNFSLVAPLAVQVQPLPRYLPSPSVAEASSSSSSSSTLDPSQASRGVTVVIPADAQLRPDDVLSVQWATPGTEGAYHSTNADASGLRFSIPPAFISQHMGKHIPVYYQVAGSDPAISELHDLTVQFLSSSKWPTVQCTRPAGVVAQLSLARIVSYATFSLARWAFMAPGQRVTITLLGVGHTQVILDGYVVQAGDVSASKVTVDVPKNTFLAFTINQALVVQVKVSFASDATPANFPSLNLTLVA
ncbi:hypothetical protein AO286_05830 [Pseudomonas syringae]|uniref:hypothetical protein n=1 Tax=Pseudomonas syringae group TaxID=136849 RepID=UPI000C07A2CF|nr:MULTISPECIES: hypothetical protein [Pseudomonas syringae group]PHN72725.1 hypothetical protein AO286_05830 [Pseudomonas syringae]RMR25183.1 hypothetical protein ALP89_03252 [Pseudomonas syringae pv. persicae]